MREWLQKRYKKDLANNILTNIQKAFESFSQNVTYEMYVEGVKKIFDEKSTEALTEFAFKLYDTNKDDNISELDMFSLLSQVTEIKYHDKPLQLDKLKSSQPDMDNQSRTQSPNDDERSRSIRIQKN